MAEHKHVYKEVKHPVETLDGVVEEPVQLVCECGAIKGQASDGPGPKQGEWV
jgi:hypothetical protein